jgi:hypothetical protein
MRLLAGDTEQKRLYIHNRTVPDVDGYAEMLAIERDWVVRLADSYSEQAPAFSSPDELLSALQEILDAEEQAGPSAAERFIASDASLAQFKSIVGDFAVDGLVESQSHRMRSSATPMRASAWGS